MAEKLAVTIQTVSCEINLKGKYPIAFQMNFTGYSFNGYKFFYHQIVTFIANK